MSTTIGMPDLVTSAFGAGMVGAFANQGLVWIKDWLRGCRALKLQRQHAALGLAVALERYALVCAHAVEAIRQGLAETVLYHNPSYARAEVPDRALPAWNTVVALHCQQGLPEAALNIDISVWDFHTCLQNFATPPALAAGPSTS
ncbi:hypothetical protein V4C85_20455 [Ralstonia solanacearum]|uniref:hypothetical protein n=1 Tax=Ralstonia solanacearum TaxID=305 RepID=UPI0007C97CCC|nr:hypothetical protein [Ralstonia solanacearum]OAI58210.1 hypothetical protein RSP597_25665 [Ralstonia solanacearum]